MPARVEFRLGSIFDQECDLLVIPSSAGGTVTPEITQQLRDAGIALPTSTMPWGGLLWQETRNSRYPYVAYAAAVSRGDSSPAIVEAIGGKIGRLAGTTQVERITAPLLGAGSGDLPHAVAAEALMRGFRDTAPETAVLTISIRRPEVFAAIQVVPASSATAFVADDASRDERVADGAHRPALSPPAEPANPASAASPTRVMGRAIRPVRSKRTRVFISYSHEDAEWLERLQKHLRPLEREGAFIWDDTRIKAGAQWREEIRDALAETKVAILLVSADFLASEFIVTNELPPLLRAAEEDGATILPVIISPCRFTRMESLSRFQAVNDPAKPLVQMRRGNREKVLDQVARAVEDALAR
jgi:TIR domain